MLVVELLPCFVTSTGGRDPLTLPFLRSKARRYLGGERYHLLRLLLVPKKTQTKSYLVFSLVINHLER
jgi:hypothetical protein